MNPQIHAENSAKRYGGHASDYLDIHTLLDSSKETFCDNRHRALTHNSWFVVKIIPMIFGNMRTNSEGRRYSPKDVAEYHVLEDFRFKRIPPPSDYLDNMKLKGWMCNGGAGETLTKQDEEPLPSPASEPHPLPKGYAPAVHRINSILD